jgi:LacI family transcriptional regulator
MARTTLQDVARTAGVSLATVDRVLNRRPGVHSETATGCRRRSICSSTAPIAWPRGWRAGATIASVSSCRLGNNAFMQALESEVRSAAERFADERVHIAITHVDVFDGDVLADALERLKGEVDGVAVVALDHPSVREAIDDLAQRA